jgi:hypothetical protein
MEKEFYFEINTFYCEQRYAVAWKYIDLTIQSSATVSESERLPEYGQVGPKHVTIYVILIS